MILKSQRELAGDFIQRMTQVYNISKQIIHPRKAMCNAHSTSEMGSSATASVETANGKVLNHASVGDYEIRDSSYLSYLVRRWYGVGVGGLEKFWEEINFISIFRVHFPEVDPTESSHMNFGNLRSG
jgi:hypothetical protein